MLRDEDTIVAGRYRLAEMIGEGGMARVWKGMDLTLRRPVAVKFLAMREGRDRSAMADRFLREARIAASIRHPNVVDILDFGTGRDGQPFMVMEFLDGASLERRLQQSPPLTLRELVAIAASVLDGLIAVHRAGIVHRDIKPENVFLLSEEGAVRPKLIDFGVSRGIAPSGERRSALTTTDGNLVGTPEYMSPEQARGLRDIDWRTDLYSTGVLLYEAMTGRLPFETDAVGDLIIQIASGGAPRADALRPELGEPIATVLARAMAVARGERFESARAMKDALLEAAQATFAEGDRGSLPALVPQRMQRASSVRDRASADPPASSGSLDGRGLPWGGAAVPNPAGLLVDVPPTGENRALRAWTVDTEIPGAARRSRIAWALAIAFLPVAGIGAWYVVKTLRAPDEIVAVPVAPPPDAPIARAPEPTLPELPIPETTVESVRTPIEIVLRGLPEDARIRVDDRATTPLRDNVIAVPDDGASHRIEVATDEGRWRVVHAPGDERAYAVRLTAPRARAGGSTPNERPAAPQHQGGDGVFRELDY